MHAKLKKKSQNLNVLRVFQRNCCLGNMADILHLMGDTECEDNFRMNMDKRWSWLYENLLQHDRKQFRMGHHFHIMQSILKHCFGHNKLSFNNRTFDKLTVVVKELQHQLYLSSIMPRGKPKIMLKECFQASKVIKIITSLMECIKNA